jgi:hypothetical protein
MILPMNLVEDVPREAREVNIFTTVGEVGLRSNFRTIRIRRIFDELDRIELFLFSSTVRSN